jgi:ferritin
MNDMMHKQLNYDIISVLIYQDLTLTASITHSLHGAGYFLKS